MEKIFIQNQDSTGTINCGILVVSSQTVSDSINNYTKATVKPEYDSISNQENATSTGTPLADKLSTTGVIFLSGYIGEYVTSFVDVSTKNTTNLLVKQINLQDDWFAVGLTEQNKNLIYEIIYKISN